MQSKPSAPSPSRLTFLLRGIALVVVMLITLAITLNRDRFQDFAALGYTGAFLAMLLSNATLVMPAPGLVFVFALGSTLNPVLVGLFAGLGAALGEITGYLTGYSGLIVLDETTLGSRVHRWMARNGVLTIFLLSMFPNPVFDLAGILAGAGRMPLWRFLLIAFVGKAIQSIVIAVAGSLSLNWVYDLLATGLFVRIN